MTSPARIVVVDDELEIRELLHDYLTTTGHQVTLAASALEMRGLIESQEFDIALLDVAMPGEDGFSLARHIREVSTMGIIMVTSSDDVFDKVVGLEIGADDYISKPFALEEVNARIEAVVRRSDRNKNAATTNRSRIPMGTHMLDIENNYLLDENGAITELTATEYDLLVAFATHPNEAMSREKLLDLAGRADGEAFDRSIDVRITRIRKKIEPDPSKPQVIKTVRGAGYIFVLNTG